MHLIFQKYLCGVTCKLLFYTLLHNGLLISCPMCILFPLIPAAQAMTTFYIQMFWKIQEAQVKNSEQVFTV